MEPRRGNNSFGAGIALVVDDLGRAGRMARASRTCWTGSRVEFRDSHWGSPETHDQTHGDVLRVSRVLQLPGPEIFEIDPANRLLASQSPRRLDAEFIRDNVRLSISGLLNEDLGGPSAHPYQPPGYYANLQFPDREYQADKDEREYRRGVYMHWQRTFLQPMLANFDAPSRDECTGTRNISNSPQQALTLLNDPTFVEAARVFAAKVLAAPKRDDDRRFDLVYEDALARPAKPEERTLSLEQFLALQRGYYQAHPDDAKKLAHAGIAPASKNIAEPELAAWTQVCRVVLGLHETITRY